LPGNGPSKRRVWALSATGLVGTVVVVSLVAATRMLTGSTPVMVTAYDVLAQSGKTTTLQVKLQRGIGLRDAKDERVTFRLPGGENVSATTDDEGVASVTTRFDSPGNYTVPLVLSKRFARGGGDAKGEVAVRVFVRPGDVRIAVCDVDHTLADISAIKVLVTPNEETPALPGAREVLSRLVETHLIVYLTARDDKLLNKTRDWLAMKGFPEGPVFARDLGPDSLSARKFKTAWLKEFTTSWSNVAYGFGDRDEDAAAYDAAGIESYIVGGDGFEPDELPTSSHGVKDWAAIGKHLFARD